MRHHDYPPVLRGEVILAASICSQARLLAKCVVRACAEQLRFVAWGADR
jgi:hypothetical protein